MRFAFLKRDDGPECVVTLDEYAWLEESPRPTFPVAPRLNPLATPLRLLYGSFMAQSWMSAQQAMDALPPIPGQWAHTVNEGQVEQLFVRGLHVDVPMAMGYAVRVPVAVLAQLPDALLKGFQQPTHILTATVGNPTAPLDAVLTRPGLLTFLALEQPSVPLTLKNWPQHVNVARLRRHADRIR